MNVGLIYAITTSLMTMDSNAIDSFKSIASFDAKSFNEHVAYIKKVQNDDTLKTELTVIAKTNGYKPASLDLEDLKSISPEAKEFIARRSGHPTKLELDMLGAIYQLPKGLLHSVMIKESNGNRNALSHKNAKGLFQFTEETAREFGLYVDGKDMRTNEWLSADAAARYLSWIFTYFHADKDRFEIKNYRYVLAGYNAGIGKVKKGNVLVVPNYKETKDYIRIVMGYAEGKYYKVKRGDRLNKIAKNNDISLAKLQVLNNGVKDTTLIAETYLLIDKTFKPKYTVQSGDSLYGIAKRHSTSVEMLMAKNSLSNNLIKIGQELTLPY